MTPLRGLACGLAVFALLPAAVFEPVLGGGAGLGFAVLTTALPALEALETVFNLAFAMREKFRLTNVGDTCGRWCRSFLSVHDRGLSRKSRKTTVH